MLTQSERFAFLPTRAHGFATSGNAYDAVQCDELIKNGDVLLILPEKIIGIAHCWPIAITAERGNLHSIAPGRFATLAEISAEFGFPADNLRYAVDLARLLGFDLCEATAPLS